MLMEIQAAMLRGLMLLVFLAFGAFSADAQSLAEAGWKDGVTVRRVAPGHGRHSIHTYFNTSPESPDGRWVLFYTSTTPEGHSGEVGIRSRITGEERVLARNVTVEDAHRAACQQWISGGRSVVFHDLRDEQWVIVMVDVETLEERVLARDRQLGWGPPDGDIVPLYGPHWDPGPHRDLELLDVSTGEIRKVLTADEVRAAYPDSVAAEFGDRRVSIFFPILSPNRERVFFKLATPAGGHFRSSSASHRNVLGSYDLKESRWLFLRRKWGHPAWYPDSRRIISNGPLGEVDEAGVQRPIPGIPEFHGSPHPSVSPGGRLFVMDVQVERAAGERLWAVVVGDIAGEDYRILHTFDNSRGATSWRVSHPHPAFSPDGRRIYFNVSEGPWTELYVAEVEEKEDG